jgi:hypothetical protein
MCSYAQNRVSSVICLGVIEDAVLGFPRNQRTASKMPFFDFRFFSKSHFISKVAGT